MSSEAIIAVVGILTSGVLGPSAIAWWAARRQRHDHQHELSKELRDVLDEAAVAVSRSWRTNEWVLRLWNKGVSGSDDRVAQANVDQRLAVEQSRAAVDHLALRLGVNDPLVKRYREVHEILDQMVDIAQEHAGREPIAPYVSQINEIGRRFTEKRNEFLAAAHETVTAQQSNLGLSGTHIREIERGTETR